MSVTIITPTGDRNEAFELTRKWVFSQILQPDQWLVIDDGEDPMPDYLKIGIDYVRREPKEEEGHTLCLNIKEAIKHIKGDMILIFEDDDWYGPNYVKIMVDYLQNFSLVGERYARYYHLPAMKYRRIGNNIHASFCQTGFIKKIMPTFIKCLEGDPYIDDRLWKAVEFDKFLITDTEDKLKLHCSLKGLRGRKGIGSGHKENASYYNVDVGLEYLIRWVGEENARIYMKHVGQSFESAKLVGIDKKGHRVATPNRPVPVTSPKPVEKPAQEKITVITCTGDRLESFELCKKWMKTQTLQPDQWLVIDDGKTPIRETREFEYHRRIPTISDYTHTLCLNLLTALKYIKNDKIIIMEDDDWYHPTYINYMNNLLSKADLVGLGNLIFYYPKINSYMEKKTVKQPAFSQTAFHANIIPIIEEICDKASTEFDLCGKGLIDVHLWKHSLDTVRKERKIKNTSDIKIANGKIISTGSIFTEPFPVGMIRKAERGQGSVFVYEKVPFKAKKLIVNCDKYISVGMKGMPGRKGLTTHQDINNRKYKEDINQELLKSIIKNDIEYYSELFS